MRELVAYSVSDVERRDESESVRRLESEIAAYDRVDFFQFSL